MGNGRITHAVKDSVHVLAYIGRIGYMIAPAIDDFLDALLKEGVKGGLLFDLTATDAIDSTNLGLLARAGERVQENGGTRGVIVSTNDDITDVLYSMALDELFDIVTSAEAAPALASAQDIPLEAPSPDRLRSAILAAHRALSNREGENSASSRMWWSGWNRIRPRKARFSLASLTSTF